MTSTSPLLDSCTTLYRTWFGYNTNELAYLNILNDEVFFKKRVIFVNEPNNNNIHGSKLCNFNNRSPTWEVRNISHIKTKSVYDFISFCLGRNIPGTFNFALGNAYTEIFWRLYDAEAYVEAVNIIKLVLLLHETNFIYADLECSFYNMYPNKNVTEILLNSLKQVANMPNIHKYLNGWWFGTDKNRMQIYGNLSNIELYAAGNFGNVLEPSDP